MFLGSPLFVEENEENRSGAGEEKDGSLSRVSLHGFW